MFIWGYQRHFATSVQNLAAEYFAMLDPDLETQTFLLGIVRETSTNGPAICLEPEECGYSPEDFETVREDTEHLLATDGEHNLFALKEWHMEAIQRRRRSRAAHSAVLKALGSSSASPNARHHEGPFFSGFIQVGDYDVGVVLKISHREGLTHYRLPYVHADERWMVPASFVESSVGVFLRGCLSSLYVPDATQVDSWGGPSKEDMLRRAGDRMMEAPVMVAGGVEGLGLLFDACNYISSLRYEGAESGGGMIIAKEGHSNIQSTLMLTTPVSLKQHRAVRKLLEITSSGDSLLTDGNKIFGFGRTRGLYDQSKADVLSVRFTGHHKWRLSHDGHALMEVSYGVPKLPLPPLSEAKFTSSMEIIFDGICPGDVTRLYKLAIQACSQRHGTVLIITPNAEAESARLATQSTPIVPKEMDSELLKSVTAIDGAVLLDLKGVCYGIGVIMDGLAIEHGDPGRGARFNSSVRYVCSLGEMDIPSLVVVVSEDGTSELIPDLPRRLARQALDRKEQEIVELLALSDVSLHRTGGLLSWLSRHRFYLSPAMCEKANSLLDRFNSEVMKRGVITCVYRIFEPCGAMSDRFLK